MARPQTLQRLTHGKILTQANFPNFVETWNYIVERCENLKGDMDVNENFGFIELDDTDPEHPIIRFTGDISATGNSATADCVSLSATGELSAPVFQILGYDTKDAVSAATSSDWENYEFIARPTDRGEVQYVKLQYPLSGETLSVDMVTGIQWNTTTYQIQAVGKTLEFTDGLLTNVGSVKTISSINTTPWTGE